MHQSPKVNKTLIPRRKFHVHCVGCMLEEAWLLALCWRHARCVYIRHVGDRLNKMWLQKLAWGSGTICYHRDFDPKNIKADVVSRQIRTSATVCAAQPSSTLSHFTHTYIFDNKRKIKEADYTLIYQCFCLSLPYKSHVWCPLSSSEF